MPRRTNNRLVVLSDSEPDLGDESDISIDVNATKRSPSHLSPTTEPKIDEVFNNSNDDDPGDASDNSDDGTPSATFKKRDPSHRNPTTRSGNCTPSAIQGLKTVKRKADTGGVDLHNIILPSPRAFNRSDPSGGAGERPGKYQRLTRGQGRSTVSYDMKLHPMDDVLRPKYSANRRANGKQVPEESSDSDEDENDAPKRKVTSPNAHRRRSSRNRHQSETPIYSAKWHPLDQMLRDNASSTTVPEKHDHNRNTRKKSPDYDDEDSMTINCDDERANESGGETAPISPNRRRSARVSSSKDAQPNYDMKYHVMDATLRPKATAKRMKSRLRLATSTKSLSNSASPAKTHTRQLAKASPKSLTRLSVHPESESDGPDPVAPAWSNLQNPYPNRTSLDWNEIREMDRHVYLLQKGAPIHGNTLPQDWNLVKRVLFHEGKISVDELNSREGTELLKSRYESIRLGLEAFYGSRPEPINKMGWTISKTENFDVYGRERGSRYWKHHRDSLVEGTKTSINSYIPEIAVKSTNNMRGNDQEEVPYGFSKEQGRNEAKTPKSVQHVKSEGTNPNKSSLKRSPVLEVHVERTESLDREDCGELGVIIETEDSLIESMRGGNVPSSIMSDTALEELLFPVEQYLREQPIQDSSDSRSSESSRLFRVQPDKTLDIFCSVPSGAKAMDLSTSSNRRLAGPVPHGKEEAKSGIHVGRHDGFGGPYTPKADVKTRKRKSSVDVAIAVHEDSPGRTPRVEKIVGMNPASPGTDIPKENLGDDGSVEHSSQAEIGNPRTRRHHDAIGTPSTRSVRRFESTTSATPPYRSLFGGPLGSSSPGSSPTTR